MIFRILSNNNFVREENNTKEIKLLKRSKKPFMFFNWKTGINFYYKEIDYKRMPNDKRFVNKEYLFLNKSIYSMKSQNGGCIIIQPIEGMPSFLSIDDDGIISPKRIDLLKEDDEIINYENQNNENDWTLSDIIYNETLSENFNQGMLSQYLFRLDNGEGLILNDYFIC
jgi:hypothetical protein